MSGTILWHIELSHFNEKARWALDYKGIPYEKRAPLPGVHGLVALRLTRGKQRRLPVMELDGRRIGDSTAIIAALEQRFPGPPLYPANQGQRAAALNLEDFFDEHLGPDMRRYVWHHTLDDTDATIDSMLPNGSAFRRRLMKASAPATRVFIRTDFKIDEESAEISRRAVLAAMDQVEKELDGGDYLIGESFSVADLTAAALFTPLLCPPERPYAPKRVTAPVAELRAELEARPGGEWVHEMYKRHRAGANRGGRHLTDTTHVDNVVEGMILAAEKGRPGEAYFVTDGEGPVPFRDFLSEMLATQGVTTPDRSLPAPFARAVMGAGEALWRVLPLGGSPPLTRFAYWAASQECTIDTAKARRDLGYEPVVTRAEGLADLAG